MKYLNPTFTVSGPSKLDGITCEACVYKRGEHAEDCPKRPVVPASVEGFPFPVVLDKRVPWNEIWLVQPGEAYEFNPLNGIPR